MAEENSEYSPLMVKACYHDGCPGCVNDKRKETNPDIPVKEFFFICIATLCTSFPISSLYPFLYFMVRDFHVAKSAEDIGYYAGFVGTSFMIGRALTSVFWGMMADRYGRKPVILLGAISVVVCNIIFGLSCNYWMAISSRFVLGCLNGMLGPIKAYASEVCRPEHESMGLSIVSMSLSLGLIIGPPIGGYLAQPADNYPTIFSKESIFGRFPYFLPCLSVSLFSLLVCIALLWLPETLHRHEKSEGYGSVEDPKTCKSCFDMKESDKKSTSKKSLLSNRPLMTCMVVYCITSLHNSAYNEVFSLWAETDRIYGGLNFSAEDVGEVLAITGASILMFQLFLYRPVEKLLGPIASVRTALILSIPLLSMYPLFANFSGSRLELVVNVASTMKNILSVTVLIGMYILLNNAVDQNQRGAANGISTGAMSVFKAIAPASGGAIFAWAQKRQAALFLPGILITIILVACMLLTGVFAVIDLPDKNIIYIYASAIGEQMVFFILNLVHLVALVLTFKPFLMVSSRKNAQDQ